MGQPQLTRDELIAEEILSAKGEVENLAGRLNGLSAHAEQNDATAHAALYERVEDHLSDAVNALGRAWSIMKNGDPEDYVR